mgnify:CR=1 FL=1
MIGDTDMRHAREFLFVMFAALAAFGCGAPPYEGDSSINDTRSAIVAATAELRALNGLLQDAIKSESISKENAEIAHARLMIVQDALEEALALVDSGGDPVRSRNLLEASISSLRIVAQLVSKSESAGVRDQIQYEVAA